MLLAELQSPVTHPQQGRVHLSIVDFETLGGSFPSSLASSLIYVSCDEAHGATVRTSAMGFPWHKLGQELKRRQDDLIQI
jgi:hypothetical protein